MCTDGGDATAPTSWELATGIPWAPVHARGLDPVGTRRLPAAPVLATVRGAAPRGAPDDLEAVVDAVRRDGEIVDWRLRTEAVRLSDGDRVMAFSRWRAGWVTTWALESALSVELLRGLIDELGAATRCPTWYDAVSTTLGPSGRHRVEPDRVGALADDCATLGELVRGRGATGVGIVDTTPDGVRSGLAASFGGLGDVARVVTADDHLRVELDGDRGLVARWSGGTSPGAPADGVAIERVEIADEGADVHGDSGTWRLATERAQPLSWLVPGATRWSVRPVPESVVWAKTLAELPECCEHARRIGAAVHLSVAVPINALSAPGNRA